MTDNDLQLQLKVWKELAISKQILMRTATDALKLDPNCPPDELQKALETAIKRADDADTQVKTAQDHAKAAVTAAEQKLAKVQKALQKAEAAHNEAMAHQQKLEQRLVDERGAAAKELNKFKERVAEKERALKAINTALADTPENVVKKLKTLKKQKMDEADARKQAEQAAAALRKEKQKLEQDMQAAQEKTAQLATQYRELHSFCETLHGQFASQAKDADSVPAVPALDSELLESIEKGTTQEKKKPAGKGKR